MYEIFLNSAAGLLSHINELLSHKLVAGNCYYCMNIKNCNMLRKRNALVEMHGAEFKQAGYWLIDQIADFRTAVQDTAKSVGISGEPVLVHPERQRQSLLDLLFGDVSPWLPTKEKLLDQQMGFYYLWK